MRAKTLSRYGLGAGVGSAALLAVFILGVFGGLRDYGPESAIRKFNEAILDRDIGELGQVVVGPLDEPATEDLVRLIRSVLDRGGRLLLMSSQQQDRRVVAQLAYVLPSGERDMMIFVVEKDRHVWKVDPKASLQALQQAIPLQNRP